MVKLIIDSTADISIEDAKKLNLTVIPLAVTFDQNTYLDQVEIDTETFYKKLEESDELPTTSQPSPSAFFDAFEAHKDEEIVGIFLSSKLSGTFQSANIAKNMLDDSSKVFLVDSKNATVAETILIYEAIRLRDAGKSGKEIAEEITRLADKVKLVAYIDTIKYLQMGGRISGVKALLANSLGISPIIAIEDGAIANLSKVRSKKKAYEFFTKFMEENPVDTNYKFGIAGSKCPEEIEKLLSYLGKRDFVVNELGPVIGTHAGPKAFAIAYIAK